MGHFRQLTLLPWVRRGQRIKMRLAGSRALAAPVRRIYYNLTITLISVAVAFLVGGVGLTSLMVRTLGSEAGVLGWTAGLEVENFGFVIVGVLVLTRLIAVAYWKLARVEARYGERETPP